MRYKPDRLTDIKFPPKGAPVPKESFLKRFFRELLNFLLAPFRLLIKLILAVVLAIWAIVVGIKNLILWCILKIKNLILAILLGIKNFISAVLLGIKNFILAIFSKLKSLVLWLLPKSLAGWIVLLLALILAWQIISSWNFPVIDKDKWQAVFLTNNQVYFGHLKEINSEYTVLKEAYYLKPSAEDKNRMDLVKLGDELHGPESDIYIPKDQILFWENLKPDSQVVQLINQLKGQSR